MKVAITIDDVPGSSVPQGERVATAELVAHSEALAARLNELNVPALGFAGQKIVDVCAPKNHLDDQQFEAVIWAWQGNGHTLGNHTEQHSRFESVGAGRFLADVVAGERILKRVVEEGGQHLKYFRSPYLQTGADTFSKAALSDFLTARGYEYCPATVESGDWLFAELYRHAVERGDATEQGKTIRSYLDFVRKMTDFALEASSSVFGRVVDQIGLFHANRLNFDCFEAVLAVFHERGLEIVSTELVMRDEAYRTPDLHIGPGLIQPERWGLNAPQGKIIQRPSYPGEAIDQWKRIHPPTVSMQVPKKQ